MEGQSSSALESLLCIGLFLFLLTPLVIGAVMGVRKRRSQVDRMVAADKERIKHRMIEGAYDQTLINEVRDELIEEMLRRRNRPAPWQGRS